MAERRATNKYYPPDWDPSKGSINAYVGQHPLRERARKLDQGILIVRFELPFSIWCLHCNKHIGMGVRYNAEKKKIGMYYSTPILSFSMKCHLCAGIIEIHTDPKNSEYVIVQGARRREEAYEPAEAGVIALQDDEEREKLKQDAFLKLDVDVSQQRKAAEARTIIEELQEHSEQYWKDPYELSQKLRKKFRQEKRIHEATVANSAAIQEKHGYDFSILPETKEDAALSHAAYEHNDAAKGIELPHEKKARLEASSVFKRSIKSSVKGKKAKTIETIKDSLRKNADSFGFSLQSSSSSIIAKRKLTDTIAKHSKSISSPANSLGNIASYGSDDSS